MDYFFLAFPNSLSAFTKGPVILISLATEGICQFYNLFIWNYTEIQQKKLCQIRDHLLLLGKKFQLPVSISMKKIIWCLDQQQSKWCPTHYSILLNLFLP